MILSFFQRKFLTNVCIEEISESKGANYLNDDGPNNNDDGKEEKGERSLSQRSLNQLFFFFKLQAIAKKHLVWQHNMTNEDSMAEVMAKNYAKVVVRTLIQS